MPLLQSIVDGFDRELTRLHALRSIVLDLGRMPASVPRFVKASAEPVIVEPAPATRPRKPRRDAGMRRGPQKGKRRPASELHALASSMPSGPIVVYPKRLQPEAQATEDQTAVARSESTSADLEAASRHLAARWNTVSTQSPSL